MMKKFFWVILTVLLLILAYFFSSLQGKEEFVPLSEYNQRFHNTAIQND
ncbi:MAG: hypothetical protein ACI4F9_03205 [Lachnospiraceae bacterium]